MPVNTITFSEFIDGGNLSNGDVTVGLSDGQNAQFNNPWTFLPPGSTAERPPITSSIYYLLRLNTDLQAYEYYDPIGMEWVDLSGAGGSITPGLTNDLVYYPENGTTLSPISSLASAVLVTNSSSVPSLSTTLPAALTIPEPIIDEITDSFGHSILSFTSVGSTSVNSIQVNSTAFGYYPGFTSVGSNASIGMTFTTKNSGPFNFFSTGGSPFIISSGTNLQHNTTFAFANTSAFRTVTFPDSTFTIATAGANTNITSLTGLTGVLQAPTFVNDSSGNHLLQFSYEPSAVNYLIAANAITGQGPGFVAAGSDTNVPIALVAKGSASIFLQAAVTGAGTTIAINSGTAFQHSTGLVFADTANARTVTFPDASFTIATAGANTNITSLTGLTGVLQAPTFINDSSANHLLQFTYTASAVNYWNIINSATTQNLQFQALGTDSNIGMSFATKGNAGVTIGTSATNVPLALYSGTAQQHLTAFSFSNTSASRTVTFPDATGTVALLDANSNLSANSFIEGYTTTATAASTTTLTVASTEQQYFTGSTTQTVLLPVTSTMALGQRFVIVNSSSGVVTVQSSGANTIQAMAANTRLEVTVILLTGTTAASWSTQYTTASGEGTVTSVALSVPATSIFGVSGSPVTTSGTLGLTTTGTSGGIPYFSSTTQLATSALLTASQLILGGGAGAAPATLAAGSQYQVLVMGAANPGYGQVNLAQSAAITGTLPIGNGGTAVTSVTTSPTATSFAGWDGNKNLSANSTINGYATTATAAGTTTLTVSSAQYQFFTGTTTQTILLPVTSTLVLGQTFTIVNNCSANTGILTIQSSGANLVQLLQVYTYAICTCISLSGTTAASWFVQSFNTNPSTPVGDTTGFSLGIGPLTNGGVTPSTGGQNTSIGYQAGGSLTSGTTSVYVGYRTGVATTTGGNNTYVGYNTGTAAQNGSNNTFIGYEANGSTTAAGGCIAIGILAQAQTSTGSTSGTDGPGIAFGSTTGPAGLRGDGVPYSSNAGAGYWRARIGSTTAYYLPLFVDRTSTASAVMVTDASGAPLVSTSPVLGTATATSVVITKVNGTESSNAVTASGNAGVITTSSLSTAAGGNYAITWTNTAITATSVITLTLTGGSNTTYNFKFKCVPGSGSATLTIYNLTAATAFNGTMLISYSVL